MTPKETELLDALKAIAARPAFSNEQQDEIAAARRVIDEAEKPREPHPNDTVCDTCGSDQVQVQCWIDANTDQVYDSCESYDWCDTCGEECRTCLRHEFIAAQAVAERIEDHFAGIGPDVVQS